MNIFQSLFLGALQGITEFLPISSSGHLVIAQNFLSEFSQPGVLFDAVLHMGTLLAVLVYYRNKILHISRKYAFFIVLATIPALILGLFLGDFIESLFSSVKVVSIALVVTGIMNLFTDRIKAKKSTPNMQDSLIIGTLQAFAIIPGISRSGSTIFAGVTRGVDRKQAADFSFLLSVPAVLGASVLQVVKYGGSAQIYPVSYFAGFVTAFIFGFLSIKIVIEVLLTKNFKWFGVYCVAVGILTLVFL